MERKILEQIDPKILGTSLQEARKASGLRQHEVAERLEVARTTVVAIEKGERRVRAGELIQLAALYGRSVAEFLRRRAVVEGFVPQFRRRWREHFKENPELERTAAELERLAEDYVDLERLARMPLQKSYPPEYNISGSSAEQAAEEVAAAERNRLGLGDGPVSSLRARLENDVGLRIFFFSMPSNIAGLFAYNEVLGGCIAVNSKHPADRGNLTLAHEYGHFLTMRYQAEVTALRERRPSSARERFADVFGMEFLLPAGGLNRRFTQMHRVSERGITLSHICTLADLYHVSVQALILRLEELRRIRSGTWERLSAEGLKVRRAQRLVGIETHRGEPDVLPGRYVDLAVLAYNREELSEGQLSKILRTDRVTAREKVEEVNSRFVEQREGEFSNLQLDLATPLAGR